VKPAGRSVICPACRGPAVYAESNPWRPFCSEGCRVADLGAWASERFRVPAENPPELGDGLPGDQAMAPDQAPRH
jgi:uncharacterized protein